MGISKTTKGKVLPVRVGKDLIKNLKSEAGARGVPLQTYINSILSKRDTALHFERALPLPDRKPTFAFIDLFAGIGGMRIGFENAGGRCVFTSEWNKHAQATYCENFGEMPHGDITKINAESIPDHDVLVAGFPCQPFSIAGVSKKNSLGLDHGFKDKTQGTLFFDVCRIIEAKRPKAFLLENVKNLVSHDKGNTLRVILESLIEMGYLVSHRVVDARYWVPQHRERIYIVGFDPKQVRNPGAFGFPQVGKEAPTPILESILEKGKVDRKYTLSDNLWNYLQAYAQKHRQKGNGFGFGLVGPGHVARTLSARYYKDGAEILIQQGPRRNPRRLTPRECARIMGFPEEFRIAVSDMQAYRQFGNSVCVPLVEVLAKSIAKAMMSKGKCIHRNSPWLQAELNF